MTETKEKKEKIDFKLNTEEMAMAGLHFGHKTSRIHPKMMPYLEGAKSGIHIIDLEKTKEKLNQALKFVQQLFSENKTLLIVGTKVQAKGLVKSLAQELNLPFVTERWLGGTFTNFDIIKKRIEYFKGLEKKKKEGELEKYTKKERAEIDKELKDLEIKFGGIKNLEKLPDAVLVLDMRKEDLTIKEAKIKKIKIIAVSHTNTDPTIVDYPVPANDDSVSSIKYILDKVADVIKKTRK